MDEIREILRMVSEGVISVDEAERLIKAVGDGRGRPARESGEEGAPESFGSRGFKGRRARGGLAENIGTAVFEGISGLGGFIADTISQATTGFAGEWEDEGQGSGRAEELSVTGEGVDAPWVRNVFISVMGGDTRVTASQPASTSSEAGSPVSGGGGNPPDGVSSKVTFFDPEGQGYIRVFRSGDTMIVKCSEGDLEAGIPSCVQSVKVKTAGGAVVASGLKCRCSARTMGGDVEISGCTGKTYAKTFGGRISLRPAEGFGQIRAATNGGDVELCLPSGGVARIRATTLAGRITADSSVRSGARRGGLVNTTAEFEAGPAGAASAPLIELSTLAGNIRILGSGEKDER